MRAWFFLVVLTTSQTVTGFVDETHNEANTQDTSRQTSDSHTTGVTQQIEKMLQTHSYELSIKPANNGQPVRVEVSIMIESITDISEKNMDLTFTLCIHQSWTDERFGFDDQRVGSVVLPSRLLQKLWVPDLYFVGSKHSFIHRTTVDNTVLRVFRDGKIFYNVKLTTTIACLMTLYNFPLDTENCSLTIQSLGYNRDELLLEWSQSRHNESLFMNDDLVFKMPKFRMIEYQYKTLSTKANNILHLRDSSTSQLQINFTFKRYLLSVFFQSYFLAMSMVILAGLGMWLDPRSVPARVAISITSVLTMSTTITGLKTSLPNVSYLTAMDIYVWICFLFIFSTVFEFCVLNFLMTKQKNGSSETTSTTEAANNGIVSIITGRTCKKKLRRDLHKLEVHSRFIYFVCFILFNCLYWIYYICFAQ